MRTFLVVTLCLVAACHTPCCVDRFGPDLRVDRYLLVDSAMVGSTTPQVTPITVNNDGGGRLLWKIVVKHGSPWLTVSPDTGIAGLTPNPQVSADPTGLVVGTYRDTLAFTSNYAGAIDVAVEFHITSSTN